MNETPRAGEDGRVATRAGDRRGFVLVAALWLLVALGAVGLDASLRARAERLAAANRVDELRAREAAMAGSEYARSRLTAAMLDRADELRAEAAAARSSGGRVLSVRRMFRASDPFDDPWRDPEELIPPEMIFGDARFSLRVRDTGAALNLNLADETMLRQFFASGLRLDYAVADGITQAILDWRDEDDLPRVGGAEREEYLRAGMSVLPPNRPFAAVSELRQVMGVTPEIYEAARPHLSLIGAGRINVNAAPEPVLLALPGMTPDGAAELLRLREGAITAGSRQELLRLLPAAARSSVQAEGQAFSSRAAYRTNEVEIISDGILDGSPVRARVRLVVTRADDGATVVWREVE